MTAMKIAIITSSYPRYVGDGVGSFIHSLSKGLIDLGQQVVVFAPYDPNVDSGWQSAVDVRRVRFVWPPVWSKVGHAQSLVSDVRLKWYAFPLVTLFILVTICRIFRLALKEKIDVIYAHWLLPGGFIGTLTSLITGIPVVVHLHGSDVFVAERYRIFQPVVRLIFHRVCQVIACSADLAQRATILGLASEKVTVIPYGVDLKRYAPSISTQCSRAELGLEDGFYYILAMGRLVYKKGFEYLIRAIPEVIERFPDTRFVIAGEGDLSTDLIALARSLGVQDHIIFPGHVFWDQTPCYYAAADIVVVPSVRDDSGNVDGLPNVLLESMAMGRPIIASEIAGIPEVIEDGKNGILVQPKNVAVLAQTVCRLLEDSSLRQRLGRSARATALSNLGWKQIAERIVVLLKQCAKD
ncbi:MAG: glycosyltransferase family 4 protein [Anaerolineae bacterium]